LSHVYQLMRARRRLPSKVLGEAQKDVSSCLVAMHSGHEVRETASERIKE
jgi:hypothetical protein